MNHTFEELGLCPELLQSVADMGFTEPSPIQVAAIPPLLAGRDIVGQAVTGTGKTAAFGLPVLEHIDIQRVYPQALVLCPTRELAIQVAEEISKLGARKKGLFVAPVYGGQSIDRQFKALARGAHIVVGTPGRIMDHLERGTLRLDRLSMAVLDEADEMLDMGFRDDIEHILEQTPEGQRIMFSATMPPIIMDLARRFLRDPEIVRMENKNMTAPTVEQIYYDVQPREKLEALCRLLDASGFHKALIFCATKRAVDEITTQLQERGYATDALHGNLAQSQRDRVMGRFREGSITILLATDVAARGIDIDDVDAVINYDMPHAAENYVHRIGRTGRAGRAGRAFTFVTTREQFKLRDIVRRTTARIERGQLPSQRDVAAIRVQRLLDAVGTTLGEGDLTPYAAVLEGSLTEGRTGLDMAAALLKLLMRKEYGPQALFGAQREETPKSAPRSRQTSDYKSERKGERPDRQGERKTARRESSREGRDPKGFKGRTMSEPMVRLFFNLGSSRKVAPRDLVGAIAGETGMSSRFIGAIEVHEQFSFVEVPATMAEDVMSVMNRAQIRGNRCAVDVAQPKR